MSSFFHLSFVRPGRVHSPISSLQWRIQDFLDGVPPLGDANLLFGIIVAKYRMKMKKNALRGGVRNALNSPIHPNPRWAYRFGDKYLFFVFPCRSSIFSAFRSQSCRDRPITDSPVHEQLDAPEEQIQDFRDTQEPPKVSHGTTHAHPSTEKKKIFHISATDLQGAVMFWYCLPVYKIKRGLLSCNGKKFFMLDIFQVYFKCFRAEGSFRGIWFSWRHEIFIQWESCFQNGSEDQSRKHGWHSE